MSKEIKTKRQIIIEVFKKNYGDYWEIELRNFTHACEWYDDVKDCMDDYHKQFSITKCFEELDNLYDKLIPSAQLTDEEETPFCPYCGHKKGYKVTTDINSGKECKNPFCKKQ